MSLPGAPRSLSSRLHLLVLLLGAAAACDSDQSSDDIGASSDAGPDDALIESLEADGLLVTRGQSTPFFIKDCETLPTCFGSNVTSPYAHWNLPPGPGETRTPAEFLPPRTPDGMSPSWRLREDEAVVYLGRTPPKAAYFSYAPYVFSRVDPTTGERVVVFASFADALNLANVGTAGGDPFGADIAILFTADRTMEELLRRKLIESGVAGEAINTMAVPAEGEVEYQA